jgi:beta-glucosidase
VRGIPRLGIPDLQMNGGALGITNVVGSRPGSYSTAFPSSLALASSWDPSLASTAGTLLGRQAFRQGFNVLLGGGVNLVTEARNGRNFEYLSEDPVLTGKMIAPQLRAIQEQHVIATIKHFAFNNLETNRVASNSIVDERTMRETEILAFEIGIRESGVGAVMCSYNLINGRYACENSHLLMDILKGEWGFKGWVLSDWGATHSTVRSVMGGLDEEQFSPQYFGDALSSAVQDGVVPLARINDMVRRKLRTMFAVGVFDHRPVLAPFDIEAENAVAQRIAEEGSVLLKNAGSVLPLSLRIPSIAVIGGHADVAVLGGSGSAQVADAERSPVPGAGGALTNIWHASSPLDAIRAQVPAAAIEYASGKDVFEAVEIARRANIAIVFATQHRSEGIDVPLNLSGAQVWSTR